MVVPRDTTTGSDFEDIVEKAVVRFGKKNNFTGNPQQKVGEKPGGGNHVVDWELVDNEDENIRGLVSCKYQGTSGTAEEKIGYEVIKLLHTMSTDPRYKHGWIAMGGNGWSPGMRRFVQEELPKWIPAMKDKITIVDSTDWILTNGFSLKTYRH